MSKSTKITKKKDKAKSKSKDAPSAEEVTLPPDPSIINVEKDLRKITITIESFQNIAKAFNASKVYAKCEYLSKEIGQSDKLFVPDDTVIMADQKFQIEFDMNNPKEVDQIVSNPIIFSVFQDKMEDIEQSVIISDLISNETDGSTLNSKKSFESAISLYEALTGDIVDITVPRLEGLGKKKKGGKNKNAKKGSSQGKLSRQSSKERKGKKQKGSTTDRSSKTSRGSKTKSRETLSKSKPIKEEPTKSVGHCLVDLLPLILGKETFSEYLILTPPKIFNDDRMVPHSQRPGLLITCEIDKKFEFECRSSLLNLTIESIFNLPSIINEEMDCQICISLPLVNLTKQPTIIKNCEYKTTPVRNQYKYWADMEKNRFNTSKYKLNSDATDCLIKSEIKDLNVEEVFVKETPRIEFNCLKRIFLLREGFFSFYDQLSIFKKLVVEIYIHKKSPSKESLSVSKTKVKKGKKSSVNIEDVHSNNDQKPGQAPYLHLMAILDLSNFLYPGVTKIRVACPLTTFHSLEALQNAGLEQSYFFPPPPPKIIKEVEGHKKDKKKKGGSDKKSKSSKSSKSSKKSKGSSKKSSKKSKTSEEKDLNLKDSLPAEPIPAPPPEPSMRVFNEDGQPCFIVIEIEITEPLNPKKQIEDLQKELMELVNVKESTPKNPFNNQTAKQYCEKMVREIICDLNKRYSEYCKEKKLCKCSNQADFLTYLRRTGGYQECIFTLSQVAAIVIRKKLNLELESEHSEDKRHKMLEEIFLLLVSEVHEAVHKLSKLEGRIIEPKSLVNSASLFFFAKEAIELRNLKLADKYFTERLHRYFDDPSVWFDYAVFNIEFGEKEKAFIHLRESLSRNMYHRNSLLLMGLLYADKKQEREAEVCLLTVMVHEPRWVEGWAVLYLFYKNCDSAGGMDMAQEMAMKYLDDVRTEPDYLSEFQELAWVCDMFPSTMFFRAAVYLLKIRMYSWVEFALSHELKHYGFVHYLLAVVCYYKNDYKHALEHLDRARNFHGSDYAVVALSGHCYLSLNDLSQAKIEYSHVLESYDRPEDIHLLYVNYARIIDDAQTARKMLLIACKNHPTPTTWLLCGILYYKQNDFLSAEECFSESIALDNSAPQGWAYLTLINIKMARIGEAELCFSLALKNNLDDKALFNEILELFHKMKVEIW